MAKIFDDVDADVLKRKSLLVKHLGSTVPLLAVGNTGKHHGENVGKHRGKPLMGNH